MKYNIIKFKNFKIDFYIGKINNNFEFVPIRIHKFKLIDHNYMTIETVFIKLIIFIDFIWKNKK